jgi:putative ATP-dependent endonuclease of OLD family
LRLYEEKHPELCELREESNQFYGWSKGTSMLEKYFQWIYVPAVKDAVSEQDESSSTALGQIVSRTVRSKVNFDVELGKLEKESQEKYGQIVNAEKKALEDLSASLTEKLKNWTHDGAKVSVEWNIDESKAVKVIPPKAKLLAGEYGFVGEIPRLGHGLQRTILVTLLQELVQTEDGKGPTLFLAIEEPELYQHPPQARHMAEILTQLSEKNSQISITTHSPYFVSADIYENIRYVRKGGAPESSKVCSTNPTEIIGEISSALGEAPAEIGAFIATVNQIMLPSQNEMFFTSFAVLVEGLEDVALLTSSMKLSGRWSEFRSRGGHFIVAGGKTSLSRLVAIAKKMGIPFLTVFDCDGDSDANKERNEKDNLCLFKLNGLTGKPGFPTNTLCEGSVVAWPIDIQNSVSSEFGVALWNEKKLTVARNLGMQGKRSAKNPVCLAGTLEEFGKQSKFSAELKKVEDMIFSRL